MATASCGKSPAQPDDAETDPNASAVQNLPYHGDRDPSWIYNGLLPALKSPRIVASLKGHTVRVTGLLPSGWSKPLPFYAIQEPSDNGRARVTVVYPIATGNLSDFNPNGSPVRNGPGHYSYIQALPFVPYAGGSHPVQWGGFPYLEYHTGRGLAFHGPITHTPSEWFLKRGPVSHGCNRMQGEHVVELAHLLGIDMGRTWNASTSKRVDLSVDIINDYDVHGGQRVDVNYPVQAGVVRPTGAVRMFPTWDGRDYPRFVCEFRAGRALGPQHCDYKPSNTYNPVTGGAHRIGAIACPQGYSLESVGNSGGKFCSDGTNVWGPFTEAMISRCLSWGGGSQACRSNRWASALALAARGDGLCALGATFDPETGYCVEGENAFGPFPDELVDRCLDEGGGDAACRSARWERSFLLDILKNARRI